MRKYNDPKIEGWMQAVDLQWLYEQALKMSSIVEIGCWKGKSLHALCFGCKGQVIGIDPFDGGELKDLVHAEAKEKDIRAILLKNLKDFNNLEIYAMTSGTYAKLDPEANTDMVFIDGSHLYENVKFDIEFWLPRTNKLISGHDWKHPPVRKAVAELLGSVKTTPGNIWYKEL